MKKSSSYFLVILFLIILLALPFALGLEDINQTETNHTDSMLKIEIVLPGKILVGVVYDSLFKITNLNHTPGTESFVNVTVNYTVTKNNLINASMNASLILTQSFNKTINYYTSSGTGRLFLEESGNYTLCGAVANAVANNTLTNANLTVCKNLSAINPLTIQCNIEISLGTDKEIYSAGESIRINNSLSNESFPFIIEYWAEDLMGRVIKAKQNTSNTNIKSFTPKIDEEDRVYILKNRLVFVGCNNSNANLEKEVKTIILDKAFEARKQQEEASALEEKDALKKSIAECKKSAEKNNVATVSSTKISTASNTSSKKASKKNASEMPKIKSFYALAKKYQASINLYANVNASPELSLFLIYQGREQRIPFNRSEKVKINVTPGPGANQFVLQLRNGSKLLDEKTLVVELEGNEEKASQKKEITPQKNNTANDKRTSNKTSSLAINKANTSTTNQAKSQDVESRAVKPVSRQAELSMLLINSSGVPITGSVVYESANVKALRFAPYILIFLTGLILFGLLLKKSR